MNLEWVSERWKMEKKKKDEDGKVKKNGEATGRMQVSGLLEKRRERLRSNDERIDTLL